MHDLSECKKGCSVWEPKLIGIFHYILGLPGDVIPIENRKNIPNDGWSHYKGTVPNGKMWVEGDNEWDPKKFRDSRTYGCVPKGLIEGVVRCRIWPTITSYKSWSDDLEDPNQ